MYLTNRVNEDIFHSMNESEKALIVNAQQDTAAFAELYGAFSEKVFNYFFYRTNFHHQLAEDLTQDVFMKALKDLPNFQIGEASYQTYLLSIAHNRLVDHFRKHTTDELTFEHENIPEEIQDVLEDTIDADIFFERMNELTVNERSAMLLYYRKDFSVERIAQIIGKSENSIRLLLSRARSKMKKSEYVQQLSALPDVHVAIEPAASFIQKTAE